MLVITICFLSACVNTTTSNDAGFNLKKAEESYLQLGMSYLRERENKQARVNFNKALDINSNSAGAFGGLALVNQYEQQPEEAEKYFIKSLKSDSSLSRTRNNYGNFLFVNERYKEAKDQLGIVVRDFDYSRREQALYNLARTEVKLDETESAIGHLKQALALNSRMQNVHIELADLYYTQKEFTLSKFHFDQYGKLVRQKNARSLLLGIKLEDVFGNENKRSSYVLALTNLYPGSKEYLEYKNMNK